MKDLSEQQSSRDAELPSRASKHAKHAKKKRGGGGFGFFKRNGERNGEDKPSESAFYEALQTVREQASGSVLGEAAAPIQAEPQRKRLRFTQKTMVALLACSLLINVGEGALVYLLLKSKQEDKNTFAETTQPTTVAPQPKPEVVKVGQVIHWSQQQKTSFSKERRTKMEEHLTLLLNSYRFPYGSINLLFAPGLNSFSMNHEGVLSISTFLHNGYMKNMTPKKMHVVITYNGRVIISGNFEQKFNEMLPEEVSLIDLPFKPDDIRDPETLDKLLQNTAEQANLKLEVRMSYENYKTPDVKEELWMYLNTQNVLAPKLTNSGT